MGPDQKKQELPGLSNNGAAQAGGYPSSGAMQPGGASPKALPPQRQAEPFQATAPQGGGRGAINGNAVAGAQFKTTAQPMSGGVASYVGIPSNPAQFKPPGGALPPGANVFKPAGASFIAAGGQPMPQPGAQPGQPQPQATQPMPTASVGAAPAPGSQPSWMPNNVAAYGQGSPWQNAQQTQFALKQAQNLQAQQIAGAMRGRGSSVQTMGAGYQNLLGDVAFAGQMADVGQQAAQADFGNQMQYTQQLNQTKMQLASLAREMGMTIDDAQFNTLAAEALQQFGATPTPGSMLSLLQKGTVGAGGEEKRKVLSAAINDGDGATIAAAVKTLSKAEAQSIPADWWDQALSEAWGDDDTAIREFMVANGIPIPN